MIRTLAKAAAKLKRRAGYANAALPSLWLMTDDVRLPDPATALAQLPRGNGVVLRHYGDRDRAALAEKLARLSKQHGLVFVVAADWRLAARIKADGLHLPEHAARSLSPGARLWLRSKLLTAAAHSAEGLRHAKKAKADAVFLAPVFATRSHPGARFLGRLRFAQLVRQAGMPVMALGGVNAGTISALNDSASAGIAGIGFAQNP